MGIVLLGLALATSEERELTSELELLKTSAEPSHEWKQCVGSKEEHDKLYEIVQGMTRVVAEERPKLTDVREDIEGLIERLNVE